METQKELSPDLSPERQYEILSRGAEDLIGKEDFLEKLKSGRPLLAKAGFDPSKPDLHIGHSVLINKLRQFQELGHKVYFIVGDFTACIGDPSGQNKTRPSLSFEEAKKNAETYKRQAAGANFNVAKALSEDERRVLSFFKRLDPDKTELAYNSKWLDKLSLKDFILKVSSKLTVAQQLQRRDFSSRYKDKKAIGLHEFLYPVLQAYDSVAINADVELGGTDQLFNLLLGRELQEQSGQQPQIVLSLPLLEGIDAKQPAGDMEEELRGKDSRRAALQTAGDKKTENWSSIEGAWKMSKSLGNAIAFNDSPKDIYGKTMKITDKLLARYWNVFTEGQRDLERELRKKPAGPALKKEKEKLAWLLVCAFHGEERANRARAEFNRVFSDTGLPDQIPEEQDILEQNQALLRQNQDLLKQNKELLEQNQKKEIKLYQLVKELDLSPSGSAARRGILSGAVKKDGKQLTDPDKPITLERGKEYLFSYGKRKFKRVNLKWREIHDLKAYCAYRKIKEKNYRGQDKAKICEELAEDENFKNYISLDSVKMKIENYRYLDTGGKEGLSGYSNQSKDIFDQFKNRFLAEIKEEIKKLGMRRG